jgi:hypothetical protein
VNLILKALSARLGSGKQRRLLELAGKLEWDESYDYKQERSRRSNGP